MAPAIATTTLYFESDGRPPHSKAQAKNKVRSDGYSAWGRVRQCSAALDPGKASMAATRFRLAICDQPESRSVPEPIRHGTLAVSGLRFRLRPPTERKAAIAASDMMKSTTMVISRKINIPYAIALQAETIGI